LVRMLEKIIQQFVDRAPLAIVAIGVFVFIIGAAGGLPVGSPPLQITDPAWRIGLGVLGFVLAVAGLLLQFREGAQPKADTKAVENLSLEKGKRELETSEPQTDTLSEVEDIVAQATTDVESKELKENFQAIYSSLVEAVRLEHPAFTKIILDKCKEWRDFSADWRNGQYIAHNDYNRVLLMIYEQAQTSIFATSDATYLDIWKNPMGDRILEAHEKGKASVKRVFVFDDREELTEEIMTIMKKHASKKNVEVLAYFDKEFEGFDLTPELIRDFSIIDEGEVIGITEVVEGGTGKARWHFKDLDKIGNLIKIRDSIISGSETLEKVEQRWEQENLRPAN
jgi:hypothetical protein